MRGGRREGAGRPRGAVDHRSLPFGALTAGLARKYGEEALNILVAIMKDTRAQPRLGSTPRRKS